ncbi:uncharacterized protein BJ171DRAFT_471931 [Polychytrium aggregatum]|uniref:uncharacterized protein n=1 Tax=Polychytrium aggregatum TaxID=110093 RepID=UPI0022FE4461|nr:uncharacterized protein BJ171DRAFT_471931 [Polychytrium aggregatum]KAI9208255.1 hypothetical protein BJ171DRAFT_471931 [Polychytrium aggregatum]
MAERSESSSAAAPTALSPLAGPVNKFSNDGSFLRQFKRSQLVEKDEETKKKEELQASKSRGKRKKVVVSVDSVAKKSKTQDLDSKEANAYLQEMQSYSDRLTVGSGSGVRPLVK